MRFISVVVVSAFSAALMTGGVRWMFDQLGFSAWIMTLLMSVGLPDWVSPSWIVAFLCFLPAFVWQGLIYQAWRNAGYYGLLGPHVIFAVVVSIVSMVGSSSNILLIFQAEFLSDRKVDSAADPALATALDVADRMADVARQSAVLREMSEEAMELEVDTGGSCENVTPRKGTGAIYTMRKRHKESWRGVDSALLGVSQDLEDAVLSYERSARSQASLNSLQDAIMDILRSDRVDSLREEIGVMHNDIVDEWEHTNTDGKTSTHSCEDPEYQDLLEPIQSELQAVAAIRLRGAYIDDVGSDDAFNVIWSDVQAAYRGEGFRVGVRALIVGFLLEALQAFTIVMSVREGRRAGAVPFSRDRFWNGENALSSEDAHRMKAAIGTILTQLISDRGRLLFAQSNPPTEAEMVAVAWLRARGCTLVAANLPWRFFNGDLWLRCRKDRFPPGCEFDLWSVPCDIHTEWARAAFKSE